MTRETIRKCGTELLYCKIRTKRLLKKASVLFTTKREKANKRVSEALAYRVIMERLLRKAAKSALCREQKSSRPFSGQSAEGGAQGKQRPNTARSGGRAEVSHGGGRHCCFTFPFLRFGRLHRTRDLREALRVIL